MTTHIVAKYMQALYDHTHIGAKYIQALYDHAHRSKVHTQQKLTCVLACLDHQANLTNPDHDTARHVE